MNKYQGVFCALLMSAVLVQAQDGPRDIIMKKDSELKTVIATYQKSPTVANQEKIVALVNGIFDFNIMGRKALPKTAWEQADSVARASFVIQFKRMIENSSIKKLEIYQSDSASYELAHVNGDSATVIAHVWFKGQPKSVGYRMIKESEKWKVWDLTIDDLSTVRSYREQFKTILGSKTITELIDILKKKADSYVTK